MSSKRNKPKSITCSSSIAGKVQDIEGIIHDYRMTYKGDAEADLEYYKSLPSLDEAIEVAGQAKRANGKRHSHQYRLPQGTLDMVTARLSDIKPEIINCSDFDELWILMKHEIGIISGVGELMIYDTTHRLGAFRKLSPRKVYLHNGVREGAIALGVNSRRESIELDELPEPMQKLSASELEDILCIYKGELRKLYSA